MAYNHGKNTTIQKNEGFHLERATDLKYLGALMESSEKDVKGRKAAAWQSCDKLSKSGSHLCQKRLNYAYLLLLRNQYFCGWEAWTITSRLSKDLNGCCTRLLRTAFNVPWSQHMSNNELYGDLPRIVGKIRDRRLRFAGHSCRIQTKLN